MSEQDDGIVERHEPAYAAWLAANLDGFVLLERTYDIHRATCPRVRPLRWPESRPSLMGGGVSCSRTVARLEYVLMMFEGAVHLCGRCKPIRPRRLRYARRIRRQDARPSRRGSRRT